MDCRQIEFSPERSQERVNKALQVFPRKLLMRILAFALHLLGARRKEVAALVEMPEESVKTLLRVVLRDGFPALHDRRLSAAPAIVAAPPSPTQITVSHDHEGWIVEFGIQGETLSIPATHPVQARTVVLSLLNAKALSAQQCASALGLSAAHCRELAHKLADHDVAQSLLDKREGQRRDYRVGPQQKAEIIQQLVARTVTGHSTSSDVLAKQVNERTQTWLSARTVRWHIHNLGLANIRNTLPQLVDALKKTPTDRC
jgi:DNA-binding transcriptional regulator GbsR (MarR family)